MDMNLQGIVNDSDIRSNEVAITTVVFLEDILKAAHPDGDNILLEGVEGFIGKLVNVDEASVTLAEVHDAIKIHVHLDTLGLVCTVQVVLTSNVTKNGIGLHNVQVTIAKERELSERKSAVLCEHLLQFGPVLNASLLIRDLVVLQGNADSLQSVHEDDKLRDCQAYPCSTCCL